MKRAARVVPTLLVLASRSLIAQTLGFPATYRPVTSGVGVAGDVGGDADSLSALGVTGVLALGHVTVEGVRTALFNVSGTVATLTAVGGQPRGTAVGAQLSLLSSFGVGVDRSHWGGVTRVYVPLAAALPVVACASKKRIFIVYGVPVWSFERLAGPSGGSWLPSWGSVSAGAWLELHSGVGFQLGVGGLGQSHSSDPDPYRRVVASVGVHFSSHAYLSAVPSSVTGGGCSFGL